MSAAQHRAPRTAQRATTASAAQHRAPTADQRATTAADRVTGTAHRSAADGVTGPWRHWAALLAGVLLIVGAVAAVAAYRDGRPVDIAVVDTPATNLDELLARADLVVVGRVVDVAPGRVLSAPDAADHAVRTQLAELEVDEVTVGSAGRRLVLEEVATLGDGTPATVAGARASAVGDAGLYLLVTGDDGRVAPIGPQGRFLLDPDDPERLLPAAPGDPLATRLAALGPRGLRRAVLDAAAEGAP